MPCIYVDVSVGNETMSFGSHNFSTLERFLFGPKKDLEFLRGDFLRIRGTHGMKITIFQPPFGDVFFSEPP